MRARTAMVGAAAALAVVSACGGSRPAAQPDSDPATATRAPVTVTTTAAAPTTTTTTARTTTNPSAAVAGGRCHTPQLSISTTGRPGGASNAGTAIVLTNVGSVTCTLYGYPGIGIEDTAKQLSSVTVPRGSSYIFTDSTPHTVSLPPGASASSGFGYLDGGRGVFGTQVSCESIAFLKVTPPDETAGLVLPFDPNRDGSICGIQGITALTAGKDAGQ